MADEGVDLKTSIDAEALAPQFVEAVSAASAAWLWEQAALQGCAEAQVALGEAYRDGSAGVGVDLGKAKCLFQLAAQQGCPQAAFALADLLLSYPEEWVMTGEVGLRNGEGAVQVSGVRLKDGMPDTWCCGEYAPTAQMVNGRSVYRKVGDSRFALWYDDIGMWRLGDVPDVGGTVGRSVSPACDGARHPWRALLVVPGVVALAPFARARARFHGLVILRPCSLYLQSVFCLCGWRSPWRSDGGWN